MYFKSVMPLFFAFGSFFLFSEKSPVFEEAERLFLNNKPGEAIVLLEAARAENPGNERIYEYLGYAYEQTNELEKSISIRKEGLRFSKTNKDKLYMGIGVVFHRQKKYNLANEIFTQAIKTNPANYFIYLNRANTRIKMKSYNDALSDYILYLKLYPADPQRRDIERLIALLKKRIRDERSVIEDEARRLAEEQARQKALEEAAIKALENAASDTTNLSAELENAAEHYDVLEIED